MNAETSSRLRQVAFWLFGLICFLELSRVLDLVRTHVISGILALLAIALLASGQALLFWKCWAGRVLPLVVAWIALAYFLSPHTAFSTPYMLSTVQGALLFLAGAGLLTTVSAFQTLFRVATVAALILCALSLVWGGTMNGRHALRGGPYTDPNYYAMALLALAPIVWVSFATKPWWMRVSGVLATTLPVLLALRTVSRGAFVAVLLMLVVLFFFAGLKVRIAMVSVAVLGVVVLLAFLPEDARMKLAAATRLSSLAGDTTAANSADTVSLESRGTLLSTSINLTLEYPLLGVGPGNFGPTIAEYGRLQGYHWINLGTHNSYTQLSSETGIPGLLLYLTLIAFTVSSVIKTIWQTSKNGAYPDEEIHRLSAGMLVSLAATCTCLFFLSEGYGMLNMLWFGLANGLRQLLPEEPEEEEGELVEMEPEAVG